MYIYRYRYKEFKNICALYEYAHICRRSPRPPSKTRLRFPPGAPTAAVKGPAWPLGIRF